MARISEIQLDKTKKQDSWVQTMSVWHCIYFFCFYCKLIFGDGKECLSVFFFCCCFFFSSAFKQFKRYDCCNLPHQDNYFELWFRKLLWTLCGALVRHVIGFNGSAHHVEEKALHIHQNLLWTVLLFMDRSNHVPFLSLSLSLFFLNLTRECPSQKHVQTDLNNSQYMKQCIKQSNNSNIL